MNLLKKVSSTIVLTLVAAISLSAQTYKLPVQHTKANNDRLASASVDKSNTYALPGVNYFNSKNNNNITNKPIGNDGEIYEWGWNSGRVNCYDGMSVPQTATIDVSKFAIPHPGAVTSPYGYRQRFKRMHRGVDIRLHVGDTVRAAFDGRIRITNYEAKGYGNYVVIRHNNQLETVYGHLSKFLVKNGQYVKAGDPIALGGNTGHSTGPHLHFETRYMGYAINPQAIFDFANHAIFTDTYTFDKNTYQNARSSKSNTSTANSKGRSTGTTTQGNNTNAILPK